MGCSHLPVSPHTAQGLGCEPTSASEKPEPESPPSPAKDAAASFLRCSLVVTEAWPPHWASCSLSPGDVATLPIGPLGPQALKSTCSRTEFPWFRPVCRGCSQTRSEQGRGGNLSTRRRAAGP